jgi:uncharacterized protein YcbX
MRRVKEVADALAEVVARVVQIWRYPVKSMAGESLTRADVGWHGVAGDRRWAFVRPDSIRSGFPWLTIRERPDLLRYRPRLVEPDRPDRSAIVVATPSGRDLDIADRQLAAELGAGVGLIKQDRGVFDSAPLSLLSTASVADMEASIGIGLTPLRFRPNIVVATSGAFVEDGWVGAVLQIGSMHMRVDKRDQRCAVVNHDPVTVSRDPRVLRAVARERDLCLGVYGSVVRPGTFTLDDPVTWLSPSA